MPLTNIVGSKICRRLLRTSAYKEMSTLTALEGFPMPFSVQPRAPLPPLSKESVLENGIKISSIDNSSGVATITFTLTSGSQFESVISKGSAQLLASAAFVGTKKKSGLRLWRDLENVGAVVTTASDRENISFKIKVLADKVESAFATVSEVIVSPPRAPYLVEEAKEIAGIMYSELESSPAKQLDELVHEVAFGEGSPLGSSFFAEKLDYVQGEDVLNFRAEHFKAGNLSIHSEGLPHDSVVALAQCYFHTLATGGSAMPQSSYVGGELKVRADCSGATYAAVAFPVKGRDSAFPIIYDVLATSFPSLPKGSFSPFYTYYPSSNIGLIGFLAAGSVTDINTSLSSGIEQLKALATGQGQLDAAIKKVFLESALLNDGDAVRLLPPFKGSPQSTPATISQAAAKLLKEKPTYVVLGKTAGSPSYATIVDLLK